MLIPVKPQAIGLFVFIVVLPGCGAGASRPAAEGLEKGGAPMELTSTAFVEGGTIPKEYTGDGADRSPPLHWSGVPANTKSFALICDDPDAPRGTWVHWVVANLPPETMELPDNASGAKKLPDGAKEGANDFRKTGYGGPAPPPGKPHRYFFKIYALDTSLNLPEGATKQQVEQAMKGHILRQGQLMGKYGR